MLTNMFPLRILFVPLIIGSALTIVAPLVIFDFLDSIRHSNGSDHNKLSISDWAAWAQAIGSILAVAAAAGVAVYQQQKNSEAESERLRRKDYASRTILPFALMDLLDFLELCLDELYPYDDAQFCSSSGSPADLSVPEIPKDLRAQLRDSLEYAEDDPRDATAKILEKLQILGSRIKRISSKSPRVNKITTRDNIIDCIIIILDLQVRAEALFPYARRQCESYTHNEPCRQKMLTAEFFSHNDSSHELRQKIETRYPE